MSRAVAFCLQGVLLAAFVLSIVFLLMDLGLSSGFPAIRTLSKDDYTAIGELLLVAVLSLEGVIVVGEFQHSKLDSLHQVLVPLLLEYRSAEMLWAVAGLRAFYRDHKTNVGEAYVRVFDEESPGFGELENVNRSLHQRRRLVKQFYDVLAGVHELGVIPARVLKTYWTAEDLRIIPEILIPVETALARKLETEDALPRSLTRLQRLSEIHDGVIVRLHRWWGRHTCSIVGRSSTNA